ncbi:unnamed protein product [Blepharisma stoltei]|uniref:F-box domain-containing protein n=1 Tax=Blepharisma stoltei TaxID=1481888 RepID=A0AAU9K456_9CILI|nr:unnamed protein product [Blepharisma stoltei]
MENKIEYVVESLSQLYSKLKEQRTTESKDLQVLPADFRSKGQFQKIPKLIIRNIFLFLDFHNDIPSLYETCYLFKEIIASRHFQAGIVYIMSRKPIKQRQPSQPSMIPPIIPPNESDNIQLQAESQVFTKEAALIQLKTANAVKDFLANKIVSQDKTIDKLKKELEKTSDELRIQKQINAKTMAKVSGFQEKYSTEKKSATDAIIKIEELTEKHQIEVDRLRNEINKCQNEQLELKKHKAALRGEVIRLRNEYQECTQKLIQYVDGVSKMKSYFEAMFSPKIAEVAKNIENTNNILNS